MKKLLLLPILLLINAYATEHALPSIKQNFIKITIGVKSYTLPEKATTSIALNPIRQLNKKLQILTMAKELKKKANHEEPKFELEMQRVISINAIFEITNPSKKISPEVENPSLEHLGWKLGIKTTKGITDLQEKYDMSYNDACDHYFSILSNDEKNYRDTIYAAMDLDIFEKEVTDLSIQLYGNSSHPEIKNLIQAEYDYMKAYYSFYLF